MTADATAVPSERSSSRFPMLQALSMTVPVPTTADSLLACCTCRTACSAYAGMLGSALVRSQVRRVGQKYQSGLLPEFWKCPTSRRRRLPVCEWCASHRRAVAALRPAPVQGRSGGQFCRENAFCNAKSLKIGASGGAAQAAEANGCLSLIFTLVHHFAPLFGNSTPRPRNVTRRPPGSPLHAVAGLRVARERGAESIFFRSQSYTAPSTPQPSALVF